MGNINAPISFASHQNTVSNAVMSLVDFGFTQAQVDMSSEALIFVNTQAIRFDCSPNDPTTTSGALLSSSHNTKAMMCLMGNENIQQFTMIRDDSNDSQVFIILRK